MTMAGSKCVAKKGSEKMLRVTQIGSPIGRVKGQRQTLIGLGLNKINRSRVIQDNASSRGMIRRVAHLVRVDEV